MRIYFFMVFSRFSIFFPLPYTCSGKLVPGFSPLFVSFSRVKGKDESTLYGSKTQINDENVICRVHELFECWKISYKLYNLFFPLHLFTLRLVYVTWRQNINLAASGPLNPFEITSFPEKIFQGVISMCFSWILNLLFSRRLEIGGFQTPDNLFIRR